MSQRRNSSTSSASNWKPLGMQDKPTGETIDAVRRVIADWDGTNWDAVWTVLRGDGLEAAEIETMTESRVRQWFAIHQKPMTIRLGGRVETATNEIVGVEAPLPRQRPNDLVGLTKAAQIVTSITGDECSDDTVRRRTKGDDPVLTPYIVNRVVHVSEAEVRERAYRIKKTVD